MTAPRETRALVARVCVFCGKPRGTVAYTLAIKALGRTGDYAHTVCLRKARKAVQP